MDWNTIMLEMMNEAQDGYGFATSSYKKIKVGDKMIDVTLRVSDLETPDIEIPLDEQKLLPDKTD